MRFMNMVNLGMIMMDVTHVLALMVNTPVQTRNVLFAGTMTNPTKMELDGLMDVTIVIVKKEKQCVLTFANVPLPSLAKKDTSVISPLVMIPLVLATNVTKKTAVYMFPFVVVMVIPMTTPWRPIKQER
jgi:hypothetical protein